MANIETIVKLFVVLSLNTYQSDGLCNENAFKNVEFEVRSKSEKKFTTVTGCITPQKFDIDDVEKIIAKHKNIEQLADGSFADMDTMKTFILESTKTGTLLPGAFGGAPNLGVVRINRCNLKKIQKGVFDGTAMRVLDLQKNQIDTVEDKAFENMVHLEVVNLSHNKLKEWNSQWFLGTPSVKLMSFHTNKIRTIPQDAFVNTPALLEINFKSNVLITIQPEAFKQLTSLTDLILKYNNIETINTDTFLGLDSLVNLDLGYNKIATIDSGAFVDLKNVASIFLRHNYLETIDNNIFPNKSLSVLDLSHNLLKTLGDANFQSTVLHIGVNMLNFISNATLSNMRVNVMTFYPNPFTCPCLDQLNKWIQDNDVVVPKTLEKCAAQGQPVCIEQNNQIDDCVEEIDEGVMRQYLDTSNMCMGDRYD